MTGLARRLGHQARLRAIDLMKNRDKRQPVTAEAVLRSVVGRLGLRAGLSRHRVLHLWPKIVEPTVERHARAEKIIGNTLHVVVDSSVWMFELATIKNVLLEKVNACLEPGSARITDIRFSQRSWVTPKPKQAPEVRAPRLDEQDHRIVRQLLEPIKDDTLRSILKRILEKDRLLKRRGEPKP